TEMLEDRRVHRELPGGALQRIARIVETSHLEVRPTDRIEIRAVPGVHLERGANQLERFVEAYAPIGEAVAQIVPRFRVVGSEADRLAQLDLGLGEPAGSLEQRTKGQTRLRIGGRRLHPG